MVGVTTTTMMIPTEEERKSIALDAACLGRVTRLNEHCVESIATERIEEDTWKLKRLQEIQNLKSTFFKAINEAAVVGLMKRSPEEKKPYDEALISNYSDDCCCSSSIGNERDEQPQQQPQSKRKAKRASVLTEVYIAESKKEKNESWSTPEANLELTEVQESWSAMTNNNDTTTTTTTTTTTLPSPIVPYFKKAFTCMTRERIVDRLAIEVAEEAHERFWRIEKRKQLTIRNHCPCKYCTNPNPHQTQAYQQLWKLQKQRNGNDDGSNYDLMTRTTSATTTTTETSSISSWGQEEEHEEDIPLQQLKLPTKLVPTFSVSKSNTDQPSPISLRSERHTMSKVCQQGVAQAAAQAAWERTLQLSKRGTLHRVTEKCPCTYCSCSPSRQQTNRYKEMGLSPFAKRKSLTVMSSPPGSTSSSLSSRTQVKKNVLQLHASEGVESIRLPSLSMSKGINNNRYSNYRNSSNTTSSLPPFCSPLSSRKKIVYRKASDGTTTPANSINPPDAYATNQQKREKYIPPWATPNLRKTKRSIKMLPTTKSCEETIQIPSAPFSSQEGFSPTKGNNNNKGAFENGSPSSSKTSASPTPLSPRRAPPPPPLSPPTHIMNNSSKTSPTKFGIINNKKTSKMTSEQKSVSLPEGTTSDGNGKKAKSGTATDSKRIEKSLSMPETSEEKQVLSPKKVKKKNHPTTTTTTPLSKPHKKNSKCKKRGSFASSESSLSSSPRSSSFVDYIVAAKTIPKTPKLDDDIDEEAVLYRELFGETSPSSLSSNSPGSTVAKSSSSSKKKKKKSKSTAATKKKPPPPKKSKSTALKKSTVARKRAPKSTAPKKKAPPPPPERTRKSNRGRIPKSISSA